MRETIPPSPAVVVGIDGSRRAINAALWAVDEAIERDIPLRLVYAVEPQGDHPDSRTTTRDFVTAESAVRAAAMAVESTNRPVKIEVEIAQGHPVSVLLAAARGAPMLCVGALGMNQATGRRMGSAAHGLISRAHCPVAVINEDGHRGATGGCVVVEFHDTPDNSTVIGHAIDEAKLRNAPLRVITRWNLTLTDISDNRSAAAGNRLARARLERMLSRYRLLHPELQIKAVAVSGDPLNYLARHADSIQLVVVGHDTIGQLSQLAGPGAYAALSTMNCSLLICERHGAL